MNFPTAIKSVVNSISPPREKIKSFSSFVEKVAAAKQVAHAWQLPGSVRVDSVQIQLEGTRFVDFRDVFKKSIKNFSTTHSQLMSSSEADWLDVLLEDKHSENAEQLFANFNAGKPVALSSGFKGHRVIVAFDGDYLVIGNKGELTRRPIEFFKINRNKVTQATFEEIIQNKTESESKYDKWLQNVPQNFEAIKDPFCLWLEKAYPLSSFQDVGNCVWENLQTCVYGILLLNRSKDREYTNPKVGSLILNETNQSFLQWREFLQIQSLGRLFKAFQNESKIVPFSGLIEDVDTIDLARVDQALVQNIFRKFWGGKSYSVDFKRQMEKLETHYFKNLSGLSLVQAKAEKRVYSHLSQYPYFVRDLATVLSPSIVFTGTLVLLRTTTNLNVPNVALLACSHIILFSAIKTVQLARRHLAI